MASRDSTSTPSRSKRTAATRALERRRPGVRVLAHEVGDQVDRAGGEHRAVRARPARARARARVRARPPSRPAGRPASPRASRAWPARASAGSRAREDHAVEVRQQRLEHPRGVLVLEHADHRHARAALAEHLVERLGERVPRRTGCGRRRKTVSGRSPTTLEPAGHDGLGRAPASTPARSSGRPRNASAAAAASAKLPRWKRPPPAAARRSASAVTRRRGARGHAFGHRRERRVELADHERPVVVHHRQLLVGDVGRASARASACARGPPR